MKPVVIQVFGDKKRKLEPEHHRIEFPGGYISVDRTSDGTYWAHIALNTQGAREPAYTHQGQVLGRCISSRVDFDYAEWKRRVESGEPPIPEIPGMTNQAQHLAVHIKPLFPEDHSQD